MESWRESLLEDIDSLPPETLDSELQLSRLIDLLESADTKDLLNRLTLGGILNRVLTVDIPQQVRSALNMPKMREFGLPPRGLEFVIGVICCQDPEGTRKVTYQELAEQFARVSDAYRLTQTALFAGGAITEQEYNLRRGLTHRELTTGRFHQPEQAIQAARRSYSGFDSEMVDAVGYTIEEAIQVSGLLLTSLENQVRRLLAANASSVKVPQDLKDSMVEDVGLSDSLYLMTENPRIHSGAKFIDTLYEQWSDQLDAFWFDTTAAIQQLPRSIDAKTFLTVIQSLRVQVGNPDGIPNLPYQDPFDGPNPIEIRPLLELDGQLLLSTGAAFARALSETYYYRLYSGMSQAGRKKEFEDRWGDTLELWTQDVLSSVFDSSEIVMNPKYQNERGKPGETDFVIPHGKTLFVFECKSKKLPVETRSFEPSRFESHLEKGVGKAVEQATKFIKTLQRMGTLHLTGPDGSVTFHASDYDRYQPVVVLRDWYDNIATVDYNEILADLSLTPYVIDIFSLEVVMDVLDSPSAINKYVTARRRELNKRRYFSMDEIDYLGLYLDSGESFPNPPDDGVYQIGNYTTYIERRLSPNFSPDMETLLRT